MNRTSRLALAAVLLAALAGWLAQSGYSRLLGDRRASTEAATGADVMPPADAPSSSDAPTSPEEALAPSPTAIPDRLPDFSLADSRGKPTPISTWAGKSLMLNFWATWCAPCRREIPLLETLRRDWSAQGFEVIGIAVDHRPDVVDFAHRLNIDYPLLVGEEDALDVAAAVGFESPAFPFTVFTDRKSRVVALFVGELHPRQANLILTTVERLNAGDIELAAARSTIRAGLRKLR